MTQEDSRSSRVGGGAADSIPRAVGGPSTYVLDPGAAQLAAWCVLALVNQPLLVWRLPPVPLGVRLLHHAYDAGQLVAFGAISLVLIRLVGVVSQRSPRALRSGWFRAVLTGAAVFLVSMVIVEEDVSNLAERFEVRLLLVRVVASLAFAVALASTRWLRRFSHGWVRPALFTVGVAVAVGNAFFLEGDYVAVHLMVAWFSAQLVAIAVEGLRLRWPGRPVRLAVVALVAAAAVAALAVRPRSEVLRRLYSLSSSVVAPIVGRYLPARPGIDIAKVPQRYLASPWFKDRRQQPPVPSRHAFRPSGSPIVLFFTVEAMRADVLEKGKYKSTLPEMHRLRVDSAYLTGARAATSATTTSMASVFRCRYYSELRWSAPGDSRVTLVDEAPSFPELLTREGVRTVNVATQGRLQAVKGVGSGFQHEFWIPMSRKRGVHAMSKLIADLDANGKGPYFAYVHFIESHAPYDLAGTKGSLFDRYVREIGLFDAQLGRLRRHLEQRRRTDDTVIIITGDHGEAFGEHGTNYHAKTVYEEELRVGLIVHVPGLRPLESAVPVTLLDVGPTILDLFGVATPGECVGQSLMPLVAGEPPKLERPIGFDTGRRVQGLYLDDGKKVILDLRRHTVEVYDLVADPHERTNLAERGEPSVDAAIEATKLFFDVHRRKDLGYEPPWQKF